LRAVDGRRQERLWRLVTERVSERTSGMGWVGVVCGVAVEVLGIDGSAISLRAREHDQELIAADGDWAASLEELQYTVGEGPGVEAFASGGPVLVSDLTVDEERWPGFADAAAEHGLGAAFAFPLQLGAILLGTLDLYRRASGPLPPEELSDGLALASIATTALLTDSVGEGERHARWAQSDVVGYYDDVNVATGMLATELKISLEDALLRLRAHAFSIKRPVTEVAKAVLDRQLRFDPPQE
jgi:hypothetical protein